MTYSKKRKIPTGLTNKNPLSRKDKKLPLTRKVPKKEKIPKWISDLNKQGEE